MLPGFWHLQGPGYKAWLYGKGCHEGTGDNGRSTCQDKGIVRSNMY